MARTNKQIISLLRIVLTEHKDFWDTQMGELRRYKNAYENKFWDGELEYDDSMIRVETADCFSYVEGFIAALFSKAPAVVVGADAANAAGDPELAQAAANRFLFSQREQLEIASRLALIYPNAYLKLSPTDSEEMLEKVSIRAVPPWEVITDRDASGWNSQRFCGHTYYLTIPEARERFGAKQFTAVPKQDYFGSGARAYRGGGSSSLYGEMGAEYADLPDDYLYIEVLEFYDMAYDKLYFWSPNYKNGEELLEKSTIPVRTYDDQPLSNLSPLYYARKPERPMEGLSAVSRVYDQFYEKNILRTYWANAVRRDSRQYIYKEGAFDEEELAKITAGIDGAMIATDEQTLAGLIQPVGVEPISSNFDRYLNFIESDINRGSILAPFSRGEATKATATEITALAQYSASEIGKMARERDYAIETIANLYLRTLSLLADEGDKAVLASNGMAKVITSKDLHGKFRISALDQGNQPIADAIKKQNLISLLPVLTGLGVPQDKLKEEIIRAYELPEDFLKQPEPVAEAPKVGSRSIPAEGELEAGTPTQQETAAGTLADALTGAADTIE